VWSNPDDVTECFQFTYSFQLHHGPEVYSALTDFSGDKARPEGKADNLAVICVSTFDASQPYRPPRPVNRDNFNYRSSPDDGLIRAETCRENRSYLIKYFVNCCETEGVIIYSYRDSFTLQFYVGIWNAQCRITEWLLNWREALVRRGRASVHVLTRYLPGGSKKYHVTLRWGTRRPGRDSITHISDASRERYGYANPLGFKQVSRKVTLSPDQIMAIHSESHVVYTAYNKTLSMRSQRVHSQEAPRLSACLPMKASRINLGEAKNCILHVVKQQYSLSVYNRTYTVSGDSDNFHGFLVFNTIKSQSV
jgi:hypothetical protein